MISFVTCDRKRALGFIRQVYPTRIVTDTPDCAGIVLDYVEKDIIRIQDPNCHAINGTIQVVQGTHLDSSLSDEILSACRAMVSKITSSNIEESNQQSEGGES